MFYSNNFKRYTDAKRYKDARSYGQVDLPHVVFFVGYDFGHGWSLGSEIEFEHGGTESAIEIEEEETGEYESEIERGGEVALEQFWLQKSFFPCAKHTYRTYGSACGGNQCVPYADRVLYRLSP